MRQLEVRAQSQISNTGTTAAGSGSNQDTSHENQLGKWKAVYFTITVPVPVIGTRVSLLASQKTLSHRLKLNGERSAQFSAPVATSATRLKEPPIPNTVTEQSISEWPATRKTP